jgi:2-aminoadipate transaminase
MDAAKILRVALEQKVAFVPGAPFHPCGGGQNTMRLNFSNATPEKIREGIARLGKVLRSSLDRRASATLMPAYRVTKRQHELAQSV